MKNRVLFALAAAGVLAGATAAWLMASEHRAGPPAFAPAANPFPAGIYANGIIQSGQPSGQNLNLYPEVSASVRRILVGEGDTVRAGQPLVEFDDAVQRATTDQLGAQAAAAESMVAQMRAQPRPEQLRVAQAQLETARANLRAAEDPWRKLKSTWDADHGATSKDALDNAYNQAQAARAAVDVAQRQFDLTRAGAWAPDLRIQERQWRAAHAAWNASQALLGKYVLRAPIDGVVLALNVGPGALVTPQGVYSTYTQAQVPLLVMSTPQDELAVRCYIDEILIARLPAGRSMRAQMSVRGTDLKVPLVFDHLQPYVTPKLALSDQRQERVDLRVLPVIFRFRPPAGARLYPGQLVDVYIAQDGAPAPVAAASSPDAR